MRLQMITPLPGGHQSEPPFCLFDDSQPFARLFEARFVLDADTEIERLLLLVQRDRCLGGEDPIRPLNNPDIDRLWQATYTYYRRQGESAGLTVLGSQLDASQRLMPLHPLFFCQAQRVFFHPPCPTCGAPLDLCRDDSLLRGMGLSPYSGSLARYLHCPACLQETGRTEFYAPVTGPADPLALKDGRALIRGFAQQARSAGTAPAFPCRGCADAPECYGPPGLAVSRIVPFAFYPFFMLIFDAPSLSLTDFSSLLAGASPDDLKALARERGDYRRLRAFHASVFQAMREGREAFLFPDGSPRRFAEILYLKLGLLGECLRLLGPNLEGFTGPDTDFSFDRLWVDLPESPGHLPLCWSFNLRSIGTISGGRAFPLSLRGGAAYGLQLLGLLWFQTLLANRNQRPRIVLAALQEAVEAPGVDPDGAVPLPALDDPDSVFAPGNILWASGPVSITGVFKRWWRQSLGIGWNLLQNSAAGAVEAALERTGQTLQELRQEIHTWLFQLEGHPAAEGEDAERLIEDEAIYSILERIKTEWAARGARETATKPAVPEPHRRKPEQDSAETLAGTTILSAADAPFGKPPPDLPPAREDDLQATVILAPDERPQSSGAGTHPFTDPSGPGEDLQPPTLILSPAGPPGAPWPPADRPAPEAHAARSAAEDLEETVVIGRTGAPVAGSWNRPSGPGSAAGSKTETNSNPGERSEDDDLMTETVILRGDKG